MLALLAPSLRSPERTRPQHLRQMCHRVSAYVRMRLADERIARSDAKGFKLEWFKERRIVTFRAVHSLANRPHLHFSGGYGVSYSLR
jgi:hypothetical protein